MFSPYLRRATVLAVLAAPGHAAAAAATAAPDVGLDLTRALFALAIVLVLLFACAWVARRSGFARRVSSGMPVKVVGSMSVGPRERILMLQVDDTWLVVGVTSGGMQTLHTLPARPDAVAEAGAADWRGQLTQAMRRRGSAARGTPPAPQDTP
ncbi:hypothetical protein GCM10025795_22820 [Verticiella sediminum]